MFRFLPDLEHRYAGALPCTQVYGLSIQLAFLSGPVGTSKRDQSCALGVLGFAEVINLIAL